MRVLIFIFLSAIVTSCIQQDKEIKQAVLDPNETSEMAILMREMFAQLDVIKSKIEAGEDISHEQLQFVAIHKTETTDESFLTEGLTSMSIGFDLIVTSFNEDPSESNYKSIVNTCISCHQGMCPGPLERIDNLILE
tara:strand:- start:78 stop:488 length:411 start_codon:yes stop_codon:yes gene_type:complete